MKWPKSYNEFTQKPSQSRSERDFVGLNREAVRNGLVNSREFSNYRATHEILKKEKVPKRQVFESNRKISPSTVYGISTRYS